MSLPEPQTTDTVLMVRPAHFGANAETAASNFFQRGGAIDAHVADAARREFEALALALDRAGVRVLTFAGQAERPLPDEVFPNNWLSLHADGTAVLYPLLAPVRRLERRADLLPTLERTHGFRVARVVDLTALENSGEFVEGTGSLVLDRAGRVAYACRSPRTTAAALARFCGELGYDAVAFAATDRAGRAIYHTNVLMSIGTHFAACCMDAIVDAAERRGLLERLERSGREIVPLSFAELDSFAGNMLELRGRDGPVVALSTAALAALAPTAKRALERHGLLVAADVSTIERVGGGSVRCMLAEVALPRASVARTQ